MTAAPQINLLRHPAFEQLSEQGQRRLAETAEPVSFGVGQTLCLGNLIPHRMLVVEAGKARLLGRHHGQLSTLAAFGPGSVVGLASLLRAAPCEEVSASSQVQATAIPDHVIVELYEKEQSFRAWCQSTLFPAELAALIELLLDRTERAPYGLLDVLRHAASQATLVPPSQEALGKLAPGIELFVASANGEGAALGDQLGDESALPAANGPFPLRLIALPAALMAELRQGRRPQDDSEASNNKASEQTASPSALAELQPTSLLLGKTSLREQLKLQSGQGPLEETMACFQMLAQVMELPFRRDAIEKTIRDALRRGQQPSLPLLGQLAAGMGLHVVGARTEPANCTRLATPCLMPWADGFGVVVSSNAAGLVMAHPRLGWLELKPAEVAEACGEEALEVILVDRTNATPEQKFNFTWFWPALKRYRSTLLQVLLASFVVQLFTLANPLLIQVIIDKVISQRSLDTLQVLGIGLVVVTLFEGVLGSLRTFLFADTTNRIDLRLGAEVIDHLLRLPVGYFDRRPVGELGTRIAELEKIRNFLTGQALTTILDAAFSVIYIVVMALYSWVLTIVALIVVPIQVGLTLVGAPLFRRQFRQAAEENASTQAHLVEVLTGIQTVKAQNVEMVSRWKWQERYSRYIARTFEKTVTGTALNETGQVLQKLSQLMVLWVGATLVLKGELTLGQLIAFRIISGYVTQPLLRLSNIWQNIQELRVSFERLADVVDTPEESSAADKAKIPLPPLKGEVQFEDLQFRFQAGSPQVLKNINLTIPAGTFVGVVGQSGSGKSTLMKLLPRLYSPEQGRILIDGYDIDKVELYSLRRQIGIVPQEPLLFSGSVSDNIALTDPNATSEAIVRAATISCAHEFIMGLPSGYSSQLGERGASLSGGQRQRLAIARTLLANPQLLVMDEATSALDYDTERRVCQNLRESLTGCTVFFVTHRLSTVRNADLIVMLHQGAIVETGTHQELMERQGRYFALYRQQEAV
ncbi:ABC transporter transmembrane domain-containing protein [Synechococcus sp. CBW1107]|uniref:ABC transporter transmembrane domain-containing protein n=1 Tax=Synechococcus sp. CBW1107 TaxID=2789857 RepID=UPI002AD46CD8|nr:ABC transporter transmembrane domain-containing protein [Synechococcus sp. CBW1107]CAK6697485.1 Vitamin B12 import ATP-binding protein BtuD [Synechococcus sp. CBW1107]